MASAIVLEDTVVTPGDATVTLTFNGTTPGNKVVSVPDATCTLAPTESPAFTGNPTAPTQISSDNSTKIVTTAWSKFGLSTSLGANGYIKFPDWLGGIIIQWGSYTVTGSHGGYYSATFPTTFPNNNFMVAQTYGNYTVNVVTAGVNMTQTAKSLSNFTMQYGATNGASYSVTVSYITIGN